MANIGYNYLPLPFQDGRSFLHQAVSSNNKDIATILLDGGADVNMRDKVRMRDDAGPDCVQSINGRLK
jgi:ankyrin repeat protein